MTTKFPLIITRGDTGALLITFDLDDAANAVDQSEPLQKRVKWTAMYVGKIIEEIKEGRDGKVTKAGISKKSMREIFVQIKGKLNFNRLAEETFNEITDNLCARLYKREGNLESS